MIPAAAEKIEKEDLPSLVFPKEPVHLSDAHRSELEEKLHRAKLHGAVELFHRSELEEKLHRAMKLGNTEQNKCRILFKDNVGLKYVETTVWSYDNGSIALKYGHTIPLARVLDVQFH